MSVYSSVLSDLRNALAKIRRALPRQARGAFVAGYLLGRGVL